MLQNWTPRIITFLLWALAAGSAAFWILQGVNARPTAIAAKSTGTNAGSNLPVQPSLTVLTPLVALALGAKNAVATTTDSELAASQARFQLMGVLATGARQGVALIAIDGKPAKPFRVGAAIEDGLELTSVAARSASIGSKGAAAFTLELPMSPLKN